MLIGVDASRALRARRTGTEQYALSIVRCLLELPRAAQHRWRLYTDVLPESETGGESGWNLPDHAAWCVLPGRRLWTHRCLARELAQRPPDVLFVPSHVIPLRPRRWLPPAVVTIHDLGYLHFPQAHPWPQRLYLRLSTQWSVRAAQRVIAISQATADDLQQHLGLAPEPLQRKVRVIHEAAPEPVGQRGRLAIEGVRRRYGLQRPYALYVGTLQPRKNLSRLIAAYEQLCAGGQADFDLVLAGGTGWLSEPVVARAGQSAYAEHIHLPGYVPDDELPALLAGAHVFCYVSLFEGFGLPVLEAQRAGVPVMTSTHSSLPEVAGDAALLVDPLDVEAIAQAMLDLSRDEALRQRLIAAGYANVQRFSWERAAAETLAVLEEAAGKSAPSTGEPGPSEPAPSEPGDPAPGRPEPGESTPGNE